MKDIYSIIKDPIITEKSMLLKEMGNKLVFKVDKKANKIEIKKAVETVLKLEVEDVNIINVKGKPKRVGFYFGKKPDYKKAIITLKPGQKFEYIEGV